jgi:hypothetical protein
MKKIIIHANFDLMDVIRVTKARTFTIVCSCNNSSKALSMSKNFYTSDVGGSSWFVSSSGHIASGISSIPSSPLLSSSSSATDAVL